MHLYKITMIQDNLSILYVLGVNSILTLHEENFFNNLEYSSLITVITYINCCRSLSFISYLNFSCNLSIFNMHVSNYHIDQIKTQFSSICQHFKEDNSLWLIDSIKDVTFLNSTYKKPFTVLFLRLLLNFKKNFVFFSVTCRKHIFLGKFWWDSSSTGYSFRKQIENSLNLWLKIKGGFHVKKQFNLINYIKTTQHHTIQKS